MVPSIQERKPKQKQSTASIPESDLFLRKPKPMGAPTGKLKGSQVKKVREHLNVEATLNPPVTTEEDKTVTEAKETIKEMNDPVDVHRFLEVWNEFAQKIKSNDMTMFTAMTSEQPVLEGTEIKLLLNNDTMVERIQNWRTELINHLRVQLRNSQLTLRESVDQKATSVNQKATSKDRYEAMKDKNPALERLRIKLNLDLDL